MLLRFSLTNFLKHQRYYTPILVVYFLSKGLSFDQIFMIFAFEAVVIVLMEIPSGIIADLWSKRGANILARFLVIPALLIYAFSDSFYGFLLAQAFLGLADSFKSGTFKSYIYDYLHHNGDKTEDKYTEIIGRTKYWSRIGEAGAAIAGGIIATVFSFKLCFYLSLIPALLNLINAISFPKLPAPNIKIESFLHMLETSKKQLFDSVKIILKERVLWMLILNSGIFMLIFKSFGYLYQPYMQLAEIPLYYFGLIYTIGYLIAALSSRYTKFIEKKLGRIRAANMFGGIYLIILIIFTSLLSFGFEHAAGVIIFMMVFSIKSMRNPIVLHEVNSRIPKGNKATVLSIDVMFRSVFAMIFLPLIGLIMSYGSFVHAILVLALAQLFNYLVFSVRQKKSIKGGV